MRAKLHDDKCHDRARPVRWHYMASELIGLQPSVLKWARESQGCSLEDVARYLSREVDEIQSWESGDSAPTYAQMEKLAYGLFKRPLATFFLPNAPVELKPVQEFRTLPDSDLDELAADTRYQLRLAHALQLSLHELNESRNPASNKIFRDVHISITEGPEIAATSVRSYLGVTLDTQAGWKNNDDALKAWRRR